MTAFSIIAKVAGNPNFNALRKAAKDKNLELKQIEERLINSVIVDNPAQSTSFKKTLTNVFRLMLPIKGYLIFSPVENTRVLKHAT